MARIVRNAIGQVGCIIADYSEAALEEARRTGAHVIADRPPKRMELALRQARSSGEIAGLIVVDAARDGVPPYPGAPQRPRRLILANGNHSAKEAIAFDLHSMGHDFAQIGDWLKVDTETAKTFVRRAEQKNRRYPELDDAMHRIALADGDD